MRKALLLFLMACLLLSCRSGKAGIDAIDAAIAQGEAHSVEGRYDAAVIALTQALEEAGRLGDRKLLARCYYELSETCNRAFFYEEGLSAADSAWQMSLQTGIPSLADSARYQQALSLIGLEEYSDAGRILDSLLTDSPPSLLASRATAAKAFLAIEFENNPKKALALFEHALSLDDAFDNHEYASAYAYCLAAVILYFRARDKKSQEERTELLAWASSLEEQRNDLSAAQAKIRSDYARIYQSYFQQIGRIREIVDSSPEKEKGVYYQLSQLIKDIRLDKKGQHAFETRVNRDLDDIMKHFREDFPKYYEDTYRFISYVFAGFDATTIRLLTGMASDAAVHTKKSGIKKTILASDSLHKDQYLLFL